MFESKNNRYEKKLDNSIYKKEKPEAKKLESRETTTDKPIPKPPPQYWTDPLSYRRSHRESEGTSNVL